MNIKTIRKELKAMVPEFAARVAPIYQLLGWEWRDSGVPTQEDIEKALNRQIDCLKGNIISTGSGGVEAYRRKPTKDDPGEYGLQFNITSSRFY